MSVSRHICFAVLAAVFVPGCYPNHAPVFLDLGNESIRTGETLAIELVAFDEDTDELFFSALDEPDGADLVQADGTTARFTWTPIASDAGEDGRGRNHVVTFMVSDGMTTTSQSIIITVSLGEPGGGAPVFITPSAYVLDLEQGDAIDIAIEVRDRDSEVVDLGLVQGIEGGEFRTTPGSKRATFHWTPSIAQIAEKRAWWMRVEADDRINPPVFHDITILISRTGG